MRWAVAYGVSDDPGRFWSFDWARDQLGFVPIDSAARRRTDAQAGPAEGRR